MSALCISLTRRATEDEWATAWRDCPYATFFQSPYWSRVCHDTLGLKSFHAEKCVFSDGAAALVPVGVKSEARGLSTRHVMSALGTYGGWLSSAPLSSAHAQLLCDGILKRPSLSWRISPYLPDVPGHVRAMGASDFTSVLALGDGFAAVYGRWSRQHRASTKKAAQNGVQVRLAAGPADWNAYFRLYEKSLQRWGDAATSVYPEGLFAALSTTPHVRLWLALVEGKPAAGMVCLYARRHAVYWHGAADDAYFSSRPVHAVVRAAVQHACEAGLAWFDFNPSGGHEGVARFKRGFGTLELPAPVITRDSAFRRLVDAARGRRTSRVPAAIPIGNDASIER